MERAISATEASQRFAELLRDVQEGDSFVVTSRGRPVARTAPIDEERAMQRRKIDELLDYVKTLPHRTVGPWTRDDPCE